MEAGITGLIVLAGLALGTMMARFGHDKPYVGPLLAIILTSIVGIVVLGVAS